MTKDVVLKLVKSLTRDCVTLLGTDDSLSTSSLEWKSQSFTGNKVLSSSKCSWKTQAVICYSQLSFKISKAKFVTFLLKNVPDFRQAQCSQKVGSLKSHLFQWEMFTSEINFFWLKAIGLHNPVGHLLNITRYVFRHWRSLRKTLPFMSMCPKYLLKIAVKATEWDVIYQEYYCSVHKVSKQEWCANFAILLKLYLLCSALNFKVHIVDCIIISFYYIQSAWIMKGGRYSFKTKLAFF